MADTNEGQTESLEKTVEPLGPIDETALAELLKESLAGDDDPEPQPEELKEESESPEEPPVSAGEEEGEDVLSQEEETTEAEAEPTAEEGLTPEQQEKFNKRIGKEVRKRKELEERNAELEVELAEKPLTEEIAVQATEENPFAKLNSIEEVRKALLQQEQVLEWAEDNPDEGELTTKDGVMQYDADQMKEFRRNASKAIRRHLPDRAEFIQTRDSLEPEVLESYPWWNDKASSEYQNAKMAIRENPWIANTPNYKLIIGDAMAGQLLRMSSKEENSEPKKKAVPKAPDQPTAPAAAPAPVDPTAARSAAAMEEFHASPGLDELTKVFAAQDKL